MAWRPTDRGRENHTATSDSPPRPAHIRPHESFCHRAGCRSLSLIAPTTSRGAIANARTYGPVHSPTYVAAPVDRCCFSSRLSRHNHRRCRTRNPIVPIRSYQNPCFVGCSDALFQSQAVSCSVAYYSINAVPDRALVSALRSGGTRNRPRNLTFRGRA